MAKVRNNIITQGLSGSLGDQLIFRKDKAGRTIVAVKPAFDPNRGLTDSQIAHQEAFRQAIAYAKTAKDQAVYINKAEGKAMSAFNVAVADWFNEPAVLEIDASGWNGEVGQPIRVKAQDDIHVAKVHVVIKDSFNAVVEEGEAVQADGLWWTYTTKTQIPMASAPQVAATAYDLAGNTSSKVFSY